jgi:UDP-N-acetylmuramate dehydrogenase
MQIKENISLKAFNTFGVEAKTKYFTEVNNITEISSIIKNPIFKGCNFLLLGGGSNILLTKDFDGIVVKINNKGIEIEKVDSEFVYLKVQAGEVWEEFVNHCVHNNWGGVENLTLIPGNVGTCPVQNIGAYGVEVKDVIQSVEAIDIESGEVKIFSNEDCKFGYRSSIFKNEAKDKYIITAVNFRLTKKPVFITHYGDVNKELEFMNVQPSIFHISKAIEAIRRRKLPDPKLKGNAGSFFKNPSISTEKYEELSAEFPRLRAFPSGDGYKLAAGWLIEKSGWKGKSLGNAAVHHKQALVLINKENATGKEILALAKAVQLEVFNLFGVDLEMEVNVI